MVKKLFTTGFFNSELIEKNLWASDFFSNLSLSKLILSTEMEEAYGNLFRSSFLKTNKNFLLKTNISTLQLNLLKNYENSFFWFLKRNYLFNTIGTINISLLPSIKVKNIPDYRLSNNNFSTSYFLQNTAFLSNHFTLDILDTHSKIKTPYSSSNNNTIIGNTSEFLSINDQIILSTLNRSLKVHPTKWGFFKFFAPISPISTIFNLTSIPKPITTPIKFSLFQKIY
jgi:hypothetical protein